MPLDLEFGSTNKSVLVHGRNGAGKSTLADAIEWFFRRRVEHLWREDCYEESLRNLNLGDAEMTNVLIKFNDSILDGTITLDAKLNAAHSNKSSTFDSYISESQGERLVLRHADLQAFILKPKGEKKKFIADIIGYDAVIDFRDVLVSTLSRLEKDPEFASAKRDLERKRGELLAKFKGFVETEEQLYTTANTLLEPAKLGVTITDDAEYQACMKQLEGKLTQQDKGAKQAVLGEVLKACDIGSDALSKAQKQVPAFAEQYQEALQTKEKLIQLSIEYFLTQGRKILDEGWAETNVCPFCKEKVDFDHLKDELNVRIDELRVIREEFEATEKYKDLAISSLSEVARQLQDLTARGGSAKFSGGTMNSLAAGMSLASQLTVTINEAFKRRSQLPEIGIFQETAGEILIALANERVSVEQQINDLQLPGEEQALWDIIQGLRDLRAKFLDNLVLSKACSAFMKQIASLSRMKEAFVGIQNAALQDALDVMSKDTKDFYLTMHPDEDVDDVKLRIVGEEGVEFRYSFHKKETGPPLKYLSESHLNSLGIALFLASVKLFNDRNSFFVLDDVVTSFDSDHRMRLVRLLEEEFKDYQILLLTHEQFWFESIKQELNELGWLIKEVSWSYENGIEWDEKSTSLRELIQKKKCQKLPIGNDVRKLLEKQLKEICFQLRVRLPYLPNDDNEKRMTHELLTGLKSTLKDKQCEIKDSPVLARITTSNFLGNSQSHDSPEEPSPGDIDVALQNVDELDGLFRCGDCGSLVSMKFERQVEKKVFCKCGKKSLEWK